MAVLQSSEALDSSLARPGTLHLAALSPERSSPDLLGPALFPSAAQPSPRAWMLALPPPVLSPLGHSLGLTREHRKKGGAGTKAGLVILCSPGRP